MTTATYDPTTDPYRTHEPTVRQTLALGTALPGGLTIVGHGRYVPGGRGVYAGIHVLCIRPDMPVDRAYSTHLAYLPSEADGVRGPESQTGHYDMSLDEAVKDLRSR